MGGYEIVDALVTDLSPDARVKASMNEINASKRLKEAASHKAEADKVRQVKAAEADAEARYLSGLGVVGCNNLILEHDPATVANLQAQVGKSFMKKRTTGIKSNPGKLGFLG